MRSSLCIRNLVFMAMVCASSVQANATWSVQWAIGNASSASDPVVALNQNNQAMFVWIDQHTGNDVVVSRLHSEDEWQAPIQCSENINNVYFVDPRVALNSSGNATAIWRKVDNKASTVQSAEFSYPEDFSETGWQPSIDLSQGNSSIFDLHTALNDKGVGVAIWTRTADETNDFLTAAIYKNGVWQHPLEISSAFALFPGTGEVQHVSNSAVAMNDAGDMIAIWQLFDQTKTVIKACVKHRDSTLWSEPVTLCAEGKEGILPDIAINNQGEALAVWIGQGAAFSLECASYAAGKWSLPVNLASDNISPIRPSITLNNNSNALLTWQAGEKISVLRKVDGNWRTATSISQSDKSAFSPKAVLNDSEQALVIYQARDRNSNPSPFAAPLPAHGFALAMSNETWEEPFLVFTSTNGKPSTVDNVVLNKHGRAWLVGKAENIIKARLCGL